MGINDPKTMLLRLLYALWLMHFAVAFGAAFLCGQAFVLGYMLDPANFPMSLMVQVALFAVTNLPLSLLERQLGVRYAQFHEQEEFLQACLAGSWSGRRTYACQLEKLVERAETTQGWERQRVRRLARRWLARVRYHLSPEEVEFARHHFGYLMPRD